MGIHSHARHLPRYAAQRPYAVKLDADRQEVSGRRWSQRQVFTNLDYAGRWAAWV